jgi:hypothetical protein
MRPDMGPDKHVYWPVSVPASIFIFFALTLLLSKTVLGILLFLHTYPLIATMKLDLTLAAVALLAGGVNGLDLKAEHAGGVFNRVHGGKSCSNDGVINNGTASGQTVALGNGMVCSCIMTRDSDI